MSVHDVASGSLSPAAARRLGAVAIVVLTLLAYAPVIGEGGFIWDDDDYVTSNVHLRDASGLARIWIPGTTHQYYPLVFTSFWIEHRIWGPDPTGYHVVNVLLHAACALLMWAALARLTVPGAWLAAAIFALHPVHVESVAWITERKNVLSGALYFAAMLAYWRFDAAAAGGPGRHDADLPGEDPPRRRWAWYPAALALFVAALLAKTVTCSLPAALVLVMVLRRAPITAARLAPLLPFFAAGVLLALHTAHLERESVGAIGAAFDRTLLDRALVAARALVFYPVKLVAPWPLIFVYPRWQLDPSSLAAWWPVAVVLGVVAGATALFTRGRRGPAVALALYAGTIFPALGFFNVFPHQFSFVADHFVYLASAPIIALAAAGLVVLVRNAGARAAIAVIVLAPLTVVTWIQSGTYESAETVWRDVIRKNDGAWIAHNNLASILLRAAGAERADGRADAARELATEARGHADRAIALRADNSRAHGNRAEALRLLDRPDEALAAQQRAIAIVLERVAPAGAAPRELAADYDRLGRLHELLDRPEDAAAAYAEALAIGGDDADVLASRARCLTKLGRHADAAVALERALAIRPDDFAALGTLASILEQLGRYERVEALFRAALAAAPRPRDRVQVTTRLVRFLATCPDPAFRDPPEAVRLAELLVNVTGPRDPASLDVLASVYAEAGRREDAIATAERALSLARSAGAADLAARIEASLERYRNGPPREQPP